MSSAEWDPELICRDDDCMISSIHARHPVLKKRQPQVHHRPSTSQKPLWQRDDPKALTGAVARATSKAYPVTVTAILRDVVDDYGPCHERTVYRHIKKLVERGQLIKLDLGLQIHAYIRP